MVQTEKSQAERPPNKQTLVVAAIANSLFSLPSRPSSVFLRQFWKEKKKKLFFFFKYTDMCVCVCLIVDKSFKAVDTVSVYISLEKKKSKRNTERSKFVGN